MLINLNLLRNESFISKSEIQPFTYISPKEEIWGEDPSRLKSWGYRLIAQSVRKAMANLDSNAPAEARGQKRYHEDWM